MVWQESASSGGRLPGSTACVGLSGGRMPGPNGRLEQAVRRCTVARTDMRAILAALDQVSNLFCSVVGAWFACSRREARQG